MIIHEDLSRLDDIYCAISSMKRRAEMAYDHYILCSKNLMPLPYLQKLTERREHQIKAIERLKQTAKKELTRLLEELK